jgi:peroxiredoxin
MVEGDAKPLLGFLRREPWSVGSHIQVSSVEGGFLTMSVSELPSDLPVPIDDGACDHLAGRRLPSLALPATTGPAVDLSTLPGRTVVYAYPRTGQPDRPPGPDWDAIPGARGCTPEACAFRDHHAELVDLGAEVFGLSTQTSEYQREAALRLQLPFALLSDSELALTHALDLPTFSYEGQTLLRRLTLVVLDGRIEHVFYPVFPPDSHATEVVAWLKPAG